MDIDELKRKFAAAPDDEDLRATLIIALRRSGRDSEAQELVKEKFACPISWDVLSPESEANERQRHCQQCDKTVHFVSSLSGLKFRAEKQECVVAPADVVDQYCEELTKTALPMLKESKKFPYCMNALEGKKAVREKLDHYQRWDTDYHRHSVPMIAKESNNPERPLHILVAAIPIDQDTVQRITQNTGIENWEVHYGSPDLVEKLSAERNALNPAPRPRFKGSIGPPPHIRRQNIARKEQERREQGLLGWIRRKIKGE